MADDDQQHPSSSSPILPHVADEQQPPTSPQIMYSPIRDLEGRVMKESPWPPWLGSLLNDQHKFFHECKIHPKYHCSCYCMLCVRGPICPACLAARHNTHNSLTIRRPSFRNAVRVDDIKYFLDITSVETDLRQGDFDLIVYLQKLDTSPDVDAAHPCLACKHNIRPQFLFCSVGCMVNGLSEDLSGNEEEQEKATSNSESSGGEQEGKGSKRSNSSPSSPGPAKRHKASPDH